MKLNSGKFFNKVYDKLNEHDEIYFDVTHAFRFIPLFATILFNYSEFMKKTTLKQVLYGAFEARDQVANVAPIFDLTNIIRLQKLTEAAAAFEKYGKMSEASNIFRGMKVDGHVRTFCSTAAKLEQRLSINDMDWIRDGNNYISKTGFHRIEDEHIDKPSMELLDRLYTRMVCDANAEHTGHFQQQNTPGNILKAIEWDLNYDMLPQAVTMLQEYIKEFFVEKFPKIRETIPEIDRPDRDEDRKEFVSKILNISDTDINADNFNNILATYKKLAKDILEKDLIKKFRPKFQSLTTIRNSINHAHPSRENDTKKLFNSFKRRVQKIYEELLPDLK